MIKKGEKRAVVLVRLPFRQPFLAASLGFTLFGFPPNAGFLVKAATLQFAKQSFSRQFLFGDFERLFDIVIEDFNFHRFVLSLSYVIVPLEALTQQGAECNTAP
ncbi:exported protein of unknown function [Candidatus Nitrospira inopinata]|uniref:Uncharacterized protein n=1 Tax=Candidatus Nitrospira inopinata TaxID=1715989 RepID=A0A0S4KQI2_9BACT|nr:exported protein of unknown function [Candidatus Nitrospira inopinata]